MVMDRLTVRIEAAESVLESIDRIHFR